MYFDKILAPGVFFDTGWFCRFGNVERTTQVLPTAAGDHINWDTLPGGADVGSDVVTYDGSDPLIQGLDNGLPVPAFTLPLTSV